MHVLCHLYHPVRFSSLCSISFAPNHDSNFSQIPTNAIVRRIGVRIWITFVVTAWGAVTIGMGFVKHWSVLALCRALIGAFEVTTTSRIAPDF